MHISDLGPELLNQMLFGGEGQQLELEQASRAVMTRV